MSDLTRHLRRQAGRQDMATCKVMLKAADRIDKLEDKCSALQAHMDLLRAFVVHHKAGVTFEQTCSLIEICTEHNLVEAALKGE